MQDKILLWYTHITFSTGKSFLKKFLGNGGMSGMSGMSVVFIDKISSRFIPFIPLRVSRARLFCFENRQPVENTIGD